MKFLQNSVIAAVVATAAFLSVSTSEAMPVQQATVAVEQQSNVTNVAWRRACRFGKCRRVWVGRRIVVVPRVVIRPRYVRPRIVVRRTYNAHINWCLGRYRSYDPATNTFVGYDGRLHVCVSPY